MAGELMGSSDFGPDAHFTHDRHGHGRRDSLRYQNVVYSQPEQPHGSSCNAHQELRRLLQRTEQLKQQGQTVLVILDEAYSSSPAHR